MLKVGNSNLIFHMRSNYVPESREHCANSYEWVWCGSTWDG